MPLHAFLATAEGFMEVRTMVSRVVAAGLTLAFVTFGCGGAQEEHRGVSRPLEVGTVHSSSNQRDDVDVPEAIRTQWKECVNRRAGQWSERSHAIQFDATANDRGEVIEVKVQSTTLRDDEVVECLRQTIAAMTVPEQTLRPRAVRPFSGGERMMRERRGPIGNSESENPFVLLGPFIVEAIGMDVIIQVGVGIIAAVATIALPKKLTPKDECLDNYEACMDSALGNRVVDVHGTSLCATCRRSCQDGGYWPASVLVTRRWESCKY